MLYKVICDWISEKITLMNDTLPEQEKLKPVNVNFEPDMLPANLRDNSYFIKLSEVAFGDDEAGEISVNVKLEFHFRLYKRSTEIYKKLIDEKLFRFCNILNYNTESGLEYVSSGITIANKCGINISQIDKAYKGGEYIFPVVGFELQIFSNE
ncbi:MAG TPA: hypothetical protein DCX92_01205 [Bacteroidetes bacterium]|nr:hypothetical protein [Bacteroidota bacterium]